MSCNNKNIVPGTPAWENICQQCGLCCLVKYDDGCGNVYMTRVACENLDIKTKKCKCYAADYDLRGNADAGCFARDGGRLNYESLRNDYLVPGFCPYVQRFVAPSRLRRPDLTGVVLVPESQCVGDLADYVIPDSWKQFRYNPHINKILQKKR